MTIILSVLVGIALGFLSGWYWVNMTVKIALKISKDFADARGEEPPTATLITTEEDTHEEPEEPEPPRNPDGLTIDFGGARNP